MLFLYILNLKIICTKIFEIIKIFKIIKLLDRPKFTAVFIILGKN